MMIQSITYTEAYVDPTAARQQLTKAKFLLSGCSAYPRENPLSPRLAVSFTYPISDDDATRAMSIIASLAEPEEESLDAEVDGGAMAIDVDGGGKIEPKPVESLVEEVQVMGATFTVTKAKVKS